MPPPHLHLSRRLAYVLRHRPESVGITLDAAGWVPLDSLVAALGDVDIAQIRAVVAENDKQRFALSEDGLRIRASQGHSVPIDLALPPRAPPALLYHGTVARFLPSILAGGLRAGSRRHVHLSADRDTATTVGARRGSPVILVVQAGRMAVAGHPFWQSANGVWLTNQVPPEFLRRD